MKPILACLSLVLFLAACGKSDDESSNSTSSGSGDTSSGDSGSSGEEPKKPYEDLSKPYLTEQRLGNMINSLKEQENPFEILAKGGAWNPGARLNEANAFARKHGFADTEEYLGAWSRTFSTWMAVKMEDVNKNSIEGYETMLKTAETEMNKPDVTPEMKKAMEEQAKMYREQIAEAKKPKETGINAADLEVMRKRSAEYEKAINEVKTKK